jgi:hypothetical protein
MFDGFDEAWDLRCFRVGMYLPCHQLHQRQQILCGEFPSLLSPSNRHRNNPLKLTAVAALNCGIAFAVVADLLGVRTEEPAVHRSVIVLEADRQSLRNSAVLHPGSQGVERGPGRAALATVTVANAGSLEHAVVRVDIRDLGGDGVVVAQCAVDWDERVGLLGRKLLDSWLRAHHR